MGCPRGEINMACCIGKKVYSLRGFNRRKTRINASEWAVSLSQYEVLERSKQPQADKRHLRFLACSLVAKIKKGDRNKKGAREFH